MKTIIIGSEAIKYWFSNFPRLPKDLDVIVENKEEKLELTGNYSKIEKLLNPVLLKWHNSSNKYLKPDYLYTLKISHCFWNLENRSWSKHIWDVQWLKEKGCKFIPELFYELFAYWEIIHGKRKTSNLEMSAKDFFNNAIDYPIPHDDIHELLIQHSYFEGQTEPTYKKILKQGQEVDVCMKKFEELTEKEKLNVVFEEVSVMAEERFPKNIYFKAKYEKMLKKFITSHCKVEEGIWIIMNHKKLLTEIPFDFSRYLQEITQLETIN